MTQYREMEDKFVLRLPNGWREEIREIATRERRSMNAEILNYIEQGMQAKTTKKGTEAAA